MINYQYIEQNGRSTDWINYSINRIHQSILSGQLDKADAFTQKMLASEQLSVYERADFLCLSGIIFTKKYDYQGESQLLSKAKSFINEAIEQLDNTAPVEKKVDYYIHLAVVFTHALEFVRANHLLKKMIDELTIINHKELSVKAYLALATLFLKQDDYDKALNHILTAFRYTEEIENPILLIDVYNALGNIYLKKRQQPQAEKYLNRAYTLSKKHKYKTAAILAQKQLAVFYAKNSQYKEAMEHFIEALETAKEIDHRSNIAHCLINIGTIHAHLLNFPEALNRYSTAISIYQDVLDIRNKVILLNNIGNTHFSSHNYDTALTYYSKVLAIAKDINYTELVALAYSQLSKTYIAKKEFASAISFASKASSVYEKVGTTKEKHNNLMNLAQIAFHQRRYADANQLALQCMEKAKLYQDNHYLIACSKILANIQEAQMNYKKAAEYYKMHALHQEEWFRVQKLRHTIDAEIRHAIKEKEKAIEILRKENEYNSLLIEQNKQMEIQNEQLRSVNEELKQFAYVVSHDLKEPMRMIVSYTQLIERYYEKELSEDAQSFFGYVKDGATRMNALLRDLLEYATVGKNTEKVVNNDLNQIIGEVVVNNLQMKIEESQAIIQFTHLPTIRAEQSLLIQLFQNLISNALKFRGEENPIIEIKAEEDEERYLFSVKDNGIGIAEEYQGRIFKMFQRLHSRESYEGSGIGLSICQKIIYRLGGRIWIESEVGKGTTFFFTALKR